MSAIVQVVNASQREDLRAAIAGAQNGDGAAFERLYLAHRRRVFNVCLRMVNNWAHAEELTQDIFLQVYRKLSTFRGDSAFSTWLHRIAVNQVLMYLRQVRSHPLETFSDLGSTEEESPLPEEIAITADLRLSKAVDRVALERCVAKLPEGYRVIFVLHDVEGYEHHEIAELLGCSVGNTKSQLHKARIKIRNLLRATTGNDGKEAAAAG